VAGTPAMVVVTYRDDEVGPGHPLRTALGDLATAGWVHRLELPALTREAVATLAGPEGIDPDRLHQATDGNPFFVTEVLGAASGEVPPTVRDAVLARAARLSPTAWPRRSTPRSGPSPCGAARATASGRAPCWPAAAGSSGETAAAPRRSSRRRGGGRAGGGPGRAGPGRRLRLARDIPGAIETGRRAIELAERFEQHEQLARALNAVGSAEWFSDPD
jgi:hypothetical protein